MRLFLFIFCWYISFNAFAESVWLSKGLLKYNSTYQQAKNSESQSPQNLYTRLMLESERSHWAFAAHYQLDLLFSPESQLVRHLNYDQQRLFDFTHMIIDENDRRLQHRLDRLYVHYRGEQLSFKAGRQAVTWGNAFFFHVMDLLNPFSPIALDKEYKTGDDMLYLEWLFANGSDMQALLAPRRSLSDKVTRDASSAAVKYHLFLNNIDVDVMFASHESEVVSGLSVGRPVRESMWRADVVLNRNKAGDMSYSLVTNLDYSWVLYEHNMYGYVEYYRDSDAVHTQGGVPLSGKDYFGAGLQIELHPLVGITPSVMGNLHDHSGLVFISMYYNILQNFTINGSAIIPFGASDSEYNGGTIFGRAVSVLFSYYF